MLPLDALCQSQGHLPSRVQSPDPYKPYNSAFCLVIMQLTPAPSILALLEHVVDFQIFNTIQIWLASKGVKRESDIIV